MFGETWCKMTSIFAHIFAYIGWMALTLIAVSRALSLCAPSFLTSICENGRSKGIIVAMWIFVLFLLIPSFMEVNYICLKANI